MSDEEKKGMDIPESLKSSDGIVDGGQNVNEGEKMTGEFPDVETGEPANPNAPEPPKIHTEKSMSKAAKIAIVCLAVAVVALIGYIIADKLGKKDGDTSTGNGTEMVTESGKNADSDTSDPDKDAAKATVKDGKKGESTEEKTEEKTEDRTDKNTEKNTEEITKKDTENDAKTVTKPAVYVTVSGGNSWQNSDGFVVQYSADVHNAKDTAIDDWEVKIPGFGGAKLGDFWCAEIELEGDTLEAEAVDFNKTIEAKGTTNFGFQITFKDEAAAKKVNVKEAVVYIDGKLCDETVEIPTGANVEKKRPVEPDKGTPLESHGALSVKGVDLVDESGKLYQLKGVSTHGIGWFPQYVNQDAFKTFRDDWGANLIRIAMYTAEGGGYCTDGDKAELKKLVDSGVDYATKLGMYVIIDWHILSDNNPLTNEDEAVLFFDEMSKKYADYRNVLYEICNEPNGGTGWDDIKEYAEKVIPVIRKNSPNAVIIVGTPTWSQDVDKAAADKLDFDNVMYTLHFYAATHKDNLRDKLKEAREDGLPIFISEFSICDASGNGGIDYESANAWFQLIEDYGISYAGWNVSNKDETSALIRSDCEKTSGWTDEELSETGFWLKNTMK